MFASWFGPNRTLDKSINPNNTYANGETKSPFEASFTRHSVNNPTTLYTIESNDNSKIEEEPPHHHYDSRNTNKPVETTDVAQAVVVEQNDAESIDAKEINVESELKNSNLKSERAQIKDSIRATGRITKLSEEMSTGLIDGKYLFSIAEFCKSGCQFIENTIVDFEADKCLGQSKYIVVSMKVHVKPIEYEDDNPIHQRSFVVKIVKIGDENTVTVRYGKSHDLHDISKTLMPLHTVYAGDWLRITIQQGGEETENFNAMTFDQVKKDNIFHVEATQKKTVVGKLIRRQNYSIINKDIYCSNEDLDVIGVHLHSGSIVKVVAIESDQTVALTKGTKIFKWRAVSVALSAFANYMSVNIEDEDPEARKRQEEMHILMEDKKGVKITPRHINFQSVNIGHCIEKEIEISTISDVSTMLHDIRIVGDQTVCDFIPVIPRRESDDIIAVLKRSEHFVFKITCKPTGKGLGRTKELIVFDFGCFKIGGYVTVNILSDNIELIQAVHKSNSSCKEKKNWTKKKSVELAKEMVIDANRPIVRGVQPVRTPFFMPRRLPVYHIPQILRTVLMDENEALLVKEYKTIMNPLCFENYQIKFSVCLWFEEMEIDRLRRETDLKGITLKQDGEFFTVSVPNLRDYNPPINSGDPIDVLNSEISTSEKYEGFIHHIVDTTVFIRFPDVFYQTYKGESLNVQFKLGRMSFKRNHFAINTAVEYLGKDFLFPKESVTAKEPRIYFKEIESESEDDEENNKVETPSTAIAPIKKIFHKTPCKSGFGNADPMNRRAHSVGTSFRSDSGVPNTSPQEPVELKWFNKNLNEEQKEAVRRILQGKARPIPYIIFGPPGTGKTITLIESIIQVYNSDPTARLLACAPSNAAADVIALKLIQSKRYNSGDFVRFNGYMRTDSGIPEPIRPFCVDGEYLEEVVKHKLIICTCVTAGQFFSLNMEDGHFTHVFIDEAGYCTEPETMIPTVLLALGKEGQLILAGDPYQLGPVVMSDAGNNIGMQTSFLQRLMERHALYQRNVVKFPETKYNPLAVTKLVKNYRTNETLLKLPSQLFYDDELIACASYEDAYALCQSSLISNVIFGSKESGGVPLLFQGIQGNSARESDSPSWFNAAEVVEVMKYVRALKRCKLKNEDIGIITPYRKQVDKIKQACLMDQNKRQEKDIPKIGSVEEFQGGERKVIIISTVRSIYEDKIEQQVGRLTFIYSHKRFNVALTRAKALLICIGNPHILCKNKNWRKLITYCKELGTYKGCNLPLQLEPKYLEECKTDSSRTSAELSVHHPDVPNKNYNPDGFDFDDDDDE